MIWTRFLDFLRYGLNARAQGPLVRTELSPGFYDPETKLLYAAFAILVDYVQRDLALEALHEQRDQMTLLQHIYVRSEAIGVIFLTRIAMRASTGTPEERAHMEREANLAAGILHLYHWWVHERPNEEMNLAGLTGHPDYNQMCARQREKEQNMLTQLIALRKEDWF